MVSFEIPKWMDEFIELESKAQLGAKKMPNYDKNTTPLRNDPTTPGRSYELPSIWAKWLEENAIDGSGKILKSHE
ncbi:hypothetical protein [Pseudoalteromonas maricaloris]|uniref:hypothetical protein n=1 Tax=Pseudoalteromonas maricaloris TaxID=184924 RepID=UPI00029B106B|nr:hypothetical protein [Pseudoalteromonas flavipulchra]